MSAGEAPVVVVGAPLVQIDDGGEVPMADVLVLSCTECGELGDWEPLRRRHELQRQAAVHAAEVHDGLVEREGWA